MKKLIMTMLYLLLGFSSIAQDSLIYKTETNKFVLKKDQPSKGYLSIYNQRNNDLVTKVEQSWTKYIDSNSQLKVLRDEFQKASRKVWRGKKSDLENSYMSCGIYLDQSGTVCKITFAYKERLPIEIEDLEKFEGLIVGKLKVPIEMNGKEPFEFIHLLHLVKFNDL